jgi:phosphoribosyl 1,2-cyclic phosphodiesterase
VRFISFGSGSSGNAFLLDTGEARIVFDCGVGIRRMRAEMVELGVAGRLDAIVITHEHSDHISALKSLTRYEACPVYASAGTLAEIGHQTGWQTLRAGQATTIAGVRIDPVRVSHDAAEPLGFLIDAGEERIALFTDLGAPQAEVSDAVEDATVVVLESNYCEHMLRYSAYPPFLKRRIRSQIGHLSNDDCAATLVESLQPGAHTVWLAHLSENNNAPEVAEAAAQEALAIRGIRLPVRSLPRHVSENLLVPPTDIPSWQVPLIS